MLNGENREQSRLVNEPRRAHKFYAYVQSTRSFRRFMHQLREEMRVASMLRKKNKRSKKRALRSGFLS